MTLEQRANFATEFLRRELLAALGARLTASNTKNARADSFSESLSEETESQNALQARNGDQSRVMLVRCTNSSQQTITLVDREYDVEAFISNNMVVALQKEGGYQTLGRLRGSVVRVTKYHFATLTRCLATSQQSRETSVSTPNVTRNDTRVYLWVEALAIVEDNNLAVKTLPRVYTHPLVVERLQALSDTELEKQLMINQGLPPLEATRSGRFDDDRPLLEEDCVIPEEQEQELEEEDEWGPPTTIKRQPTDSELIEENGSVPMSEFQAVRDPTSPDKLLSTQGSMASSVDLSMRSANMSVTLSENSSITLSEETSVAPSLDSEGYLFQQENIRETFVAGSDSESIDTDSEHGRVQKAKDSAPSTPKSYKQACSSRRHSFAHSSPGPTIPKTTQSSWVTVDLTNDSPEKAPVTAMLASKKKAMECNTEANNLQNEASGNVAPPPLPPRTQKQNPSAGWATSLLRMVGISTSAAKASLLHTQSSDEEVGDLAKNDQNATQIMDQTEEEEDEKEAEPAKPKDLISSQATVLLQYDVDNDDDDDHAFEYEGMLPDDIVSTTPAEHGRDQTQESNSAGDLTIAEERAEIALTPKKRPTLKKDITSTDFKTPSPSAQTATPGTEKRTEPAGRQTLALMSDMEENSEMRARDSSHPASSLIPNDPDLAVKSPSKMAISVGPSSSRTGFSAVESRGVKRGRHQTNAGYQSPSTTVQAGLPVSQPRVQIDDILRSETQKHRRREILSTQALCMAGSQSPQFEQPVFSQRPLEPDYGNGVTNYSLNALCRSLGSRDLVSEENQARTSRQPRRAWKRYENLFPPLNMTHLKRMLAEGKGKCQQ